ncbi:MAG: ComF family protein, partial [Pseudomonadota bacterium]
MAMPSSQGSSLPSAWVHSLWSPVNRWGRRVVDLVLPPRCPSCGQDVEATGLICPNCWSDLRILAPPWCHQCGRPFAHGEDDDTQLCGACLQNPPHYDHARAAFAYQGAARKLVLSLKYADRLYLAPLIADWLNRAVQGLPDYPGDTPALVVPVPLHWRRLMGRKYNQAAELARALVKVMDEKPTGLAAHYSPDLVKRVRSTPPQGSEQAPSRHLNVQRAFSVIDPAAVQDAYIILVDDVITTGATVNELAKILKQAGAARV